MVFKKGSLISENKNQALRLFDSLVDEYANDREKMPLFREQIEFMDSAFKGDSGRILDLGCAAGSEVRNLKDHGFRVIGVDLSLRMLERAQNRFSREPGTWFCRADAELLPFRSQSVDGVVCLGLLEYLEDYGPTIAEIHRVLRDNARAVFAIPTRWSAFMMGQRIAESTVAPVWRYAKHLLRPNPVAGLVVPPHRRTLCVPGQFRNMLQRSGFRVEASRFSAYLLYPFDRFPALNFKLARLLQPLCRVPLLRNGATVYMVAARKIG